MTKAWSATSQSGFSLVEVILSTAVFALLVTALVSAYLYGQESSVLAGSRARAVFLAEEGLEAVRNIRDEDYSNLSDGTFGLTTTTNQWDFSGSSDVIDIFTRQITISTVDADRKSVTAEVTWQQNLQRTGFISLTTYITNWTAAAGGGLPPASCAAYCQALPAGYSNGTCRQNAVQCSLNGETFEVGGNAFCTLSFPGDPSQDTCCCAP